jgi:hypothetical protein
VGRQTRGRITPVPGLLGRGWILGAFALFRRTTGVCGRSSASATSSGRGTWSFWGGGQFIRDRGQDVRFFKEHFPLIGPGQNEAGMASPAVRLHLRARTRRHLLHPAQLRHC